MLLVLIVAAIYVRSGLGGLRIHDARVVNVCYCSVGLRFYDHTWVCMDVAADGSRR